MTGRANLGHREEADHALHNAEAELGMRSLNGSGQPCNETDEHVQLAIEVALYQGCGGPNLVRSPSNVDAAFSVMLHGRNGGAQVGRLHQPKFLSHGR